MGDFHDAWDPAPKSEAERLNALMRAVREGWGYVPLSVREKAARLADAFVSAWNTETTPARKEPPAASADQEARP